MSAKVHIGGGLVAIELECHVMETDTKQVKVKVTLDLVKVKLELTVG